MGKPREIQDVSAHDVAAYILKKTGKISPWKLHKLLYYSQAWFLAWDREPLFYEKIEAWANGPVVRAVYRHHKGTWSVSEWPWGSAKKLGKTQKETVKIVLKSYEPVPSWQLSNLVQSEPPWRETRGDMSPVERGSREIKRKKMKKYYTALALDDNKPKVSELKW